jgi:pimeloyl-ACP methyl ester carboxylesterase
LRARIFYTDFDISKGTILHTTGYDSSGPEGWFWVAQPALERGYNVVLYEGPGQGAVLWDQRIPMRPDWENVFLPVVNTIRQQPKLDPDRLISWGTSLGGYLAVRGASAVPELRALILDPGQLGPKEAIEAQMGEEVVAALLDHNPQVEAQINQLINNPAMRFTLERGMFVHQLDTPSDYFREMMKYTNRPILDKITMPCWIAAAENDRISATAKPLFDALSGPKVFQQFSAAEGCGEHCELGGRSKFLAEAFSWLDSLD